MDYFIVEHRKDTGTLVRVVLVPPNVDSAEALVRYGAYLDSDHEAALFEADNLQALVPGPTESFRIVDGAIVASDDAPADELASEVRRHRDNLLTSCDWTQLPDVALSVESKELWLQYRQALRNVPQQSDFPSKVTWPTSPSK